MNITIINELDINLLSGHITQIVTNSDTLHPVSLWDFDHQTDWYVFGPASGWQKNLFGNILVTIPQNDEIYLHATHIASTVLFHRYYKLFGD
jgi:hypothetical protein